MAKKQKYWGIVFYAPPSHPHYDALADVYKKSPAICADGGEMHIYTNKVRAEKRFKAWCETAHAMRLWDGCYYLVEVEHED